MTTRVRRTLAATLFCAAAQLWPAERDDRHRTLDFRTMFEQETRVAAFGYDDNPTGADAARA